MTSSIQSFCDTRNIHSIAKALNVTSTVSVRQFHTNPAALLLALGVVALEVDDVWGSFEQGLRRLAGLLGQPF